MLRKIIIILMLAIFPLYSYSQDSHVVEDQHSKDNTILNQKNGNKFNENNDVENNVSDSEDTENLQPVKISPEEIIAIETESKKSIRRSLKNRDITERENFIAIMTWQEKSMKIRELMREGKSYKEAKEIVNKIIKIPSINVKSDKDMANYMYKKGNFISNDE